MDYDGFVLLRKQAHATFTSILLGLASSALGRLKVKTPCLRSALILTALVQGSLPFRSHFSETAIFEKRKKKAPDFAGAFSDSWDRSNNLIVFVIVRHCRSILFLLRLIGDHR